MERVLHAFQEAGLSLVSRAYFLRVLGRFRDFEVGKDFEGIFGGIPHDPSMCFTHGSNQIPSGGAKRDWSKSSLRLCAKEF